MLLQVLGKFFSFVLLCLVWFKTQKCFLWKLSLDFCVWFLGVGHGNLLSDENLPKAVGC